MASGSWVGHWCRPTRATAAASAVIALSLWIMLPWPAVPVAFRRIQARPFSAVWTAYIRWSPTETLNPPTSPIASVTPSNRSGCSCTRNLAPQLPPASSSAVNASTTSRSGLRPSRIRFLMTARTIASMSFMSTAPRPQTQPSASSPANGSRRQSSALAGTTSRWPWMSSAGRLGSLPSTRATRLVRFGCDSRTVGWTPTSLSRPATYSAALLSPGPEWSPGLVVSILIRSRQMSTTSSWACAAKFSVTVPSSHRAALIAPQAAWGSWLACLRGWPGWTAWLACLVGLLGGAGIRFA